MTRNLRTQLAAMAEHHIRFGRSHVTRERAADLLSDWDALTVDDDLLADVLSRFPTSEPPAVAGLDFFAVEQDAKTIVAEALRPNPLAELLPDTTGWDDDTSRCARCGTAFSPSYATHCVPCDGPMRVVSGGDEVRHGVGSSDRGSNGLYRRCLCGEEFIGRNLADLADKIMAHERRVKS